MTAPAPTLSGIHRVAYRCRGLELLRPTYHGVFKSIYFLDPDGHRLELA
jgi:catechol 2,3-dioxygenase-like lactoylglutathione lyase family enzyme